MRYTNYISSQAHVDVMRKAQPGMMEYQLESLFMHHTYYHGGCRFMSYTCICACGPNGKFVHASCCCFMTVKLSYFHLLYLCTKLKSYTMATLVDRTPVSSFKMTWHFSTWVQNITAMLLILHVLSQYLGHSLRINLQSINQY